MNSTETRSNDKNKLAHEMPRPTTCQCCDGRPYTDNFGEWYNGQWWCYDHVEKLFEKEGVADLYELTEKKIDRLL